jgi:hypothetical protein
MIVSGGEIFLDLLQSYGVEYKEKERVRSLMLTFTLKRESFGGGRNC